MQFKVTLCITSKEREFIHLSLKNKLGYTSFTYCHSISSLRVNMQKANSCISMNIVLYVHISMHETF